MSRPHICFIQAQCLPWAAPPNNLAWLAAAGVRNKMLSIDSTDGSFTTLLQLPPGYERELVLAPDQYVEVLMLQGDVWLSGFYEAPSLLGEHGYYRRTGAAGAGGRWKSERGAVLLLMTGPAASAATIAVPDTFALPWQHGAAGSVTGKPLSPGIASKVLRRDATTGEQSFLYCAMPQHPPPAIMVGKFTHPVTEEIFALSGSYVFGDVGRMVAGGYAFWREQQWHGPAGSETGYCLFIRVLGGPLSNQFSTEPAPYSWQPPYRPALPESMRALAREIEDCKSW